MKRAWRGPVLAGLAVRLAAVLLTNRLVGDVLRYQKVADWILGGSWNPYALRRLYPYPPLWVWFEAGASWLAHHLALPFPILVKLPVVAADVGIVALLAAWPPAAEEQVAGEARGRRAAWTYALHPIAILVSAVHGQFDSLMLLALLAALQADARGRADRAALGLSAAIAVKSFPVVMLPVFLSGRRLSPAIRFVLLALAPVALILLPFAWVDLGALRRELFGYGGIADFGWIGVWRGLLWLSSGRLLRSEPEHWGVLVPAGKALFLFGYLGVLARFRRGGRDRVRASQAVLLSFLGLYGALSAQYLLWVVPLGLRLAPAWSWAYAGAGTVALVGFYSFLQPGILWGGESPLPAALSGGLWLAGSAACLVLCLAALVRWLHRPD